MSPQVFQEFYCKRSSSMLYSKHVLRWTSNKITRRSASVTRSNKTNLHSSSSRLPCRRNFRHRVTTITRPLPIQLNGILLNQTPLNLELNKFQTSYTTSIPELRPVIRSFPDLTDRNFGGSVCLSLHLHCAFKDLRFQKDYRQSKCHPNQAPYPDEDCRLRHKRTSCILHHWLEQILL